MSSLHNKDGLFHGLFMDFHYEIYKLSKLGTILTKEGVTNMYCGNYIINTCVFHGHFKHSCYSVKYLHSD